jgi:hypothetical protein
MDDAFGDRLSQFTTIPGFSGIMLSRPFSRIRRVGLGNGSTQKKFKSS